MKNRLQLAAGSLALFLVAAAAPAPAQIDLTGIFSIQSTLPDVCRATVQQDGFSIVLVFQCVFLQAGATGSIDPMTGVFTASGGCTVGPLFGTFTISGTAAPDSSSFAGTFSCPPAVPIPSVAYTATRTCPNGMPNSGEACDDGNMVDDDACSNVCQVGSMPCDDDDPCTRSVVDPMQGCIHIPAPQTGCRTAGKSSLLLKDDATDAKDKLVWKWTKGAATTLAELGTPTGTTGYTLCIYAGSANALVAKATVPPDPVKWQPVSDVGWKYKDPAATADGVQKVLLKSGAAGKAKELLKGKGSALPDLPPGTLPVAVDGFPVVAQLFNNETNLCWEGRFDAADVKSNTAAQFKAKHQAP